MEWWIYLILSLFTVVNISSSKTGVQDGAGVRPVDVDVYWESMCPYCRTFITKQLFPTYSKLRNTGMLNITMVAYGNAHYKLSADGIHWNYTCQHGVKECEGNVLATCAMNLTDFDTAFRFINCLEDYSKSHSVNRSAEKCSALHGATVPLTPLLDCANGDFGNMLQHEMAIITDSLDPPKEYTPWIVINGNHTNSLQRAAENNFLKLVCETYTGPKPRDCDPFSQIVG